jgi:hypothetical protein
MSKKSKIMCGILLLIIPTIAYGGYFLLTVLTGQFVDLELNELQESMFRAGHAHAGVLVILSLIVQLLADHTKLNTALNWFSRIGVPLAALLISSGFFFSAIGENITEPNDFIILIYIGIFFLVTSLIILAAGLLRNRNN